ncbi:polyprenol monophosphomannose synthase [uncultured Jatrophihabitans sp.]|uniref:polyprenol monophosphomannose synthase n=1 Tax=uncultured Jatrophihabitans sp. TaxID=1610747 RepID=UPI0035CBEB52
MIAAEHGHTRVVVPTYNERANLPIVLERLLALPVPDLRVLVVDDGSPDGTGELADDLARSSGHRVQVLHRAVKNGLGRAYVAGMSNALAHGATTVIQLDADLSHPVETVPLMLAALNDGPADVVVGSRYVAGGSTAREWPWHRRALSRAANSYVDHMLHLGVRDVTSGFKAWRAEALRAVDLPSCDAQGYAFQIELAFRCRRLGLVVEELPIRFADRSHGRSKMTFAVQREAAVLPWRLRRRGVPVVTAVPARPAVEALTGSR